MTRNTLDPEKVKIISNGVPNLLTGDAFKLLNEGAILIDMRKEFFWRWKRFDVESCLCLPPDKVQQHITECPDQQVFILTETSTSEKSSKIISNLIQNGVKHIYNLAGGFVEWERGGFPIIEEKRNRLSGSCMCQLKPRTKPE